MDCLVPNRIPAAQVQDYSSEAEECRHALWKLYTLSWSKLAVFKDSSSYHEVGDVWWRRGKGRENHELHAVIHLYSKFLVMFGAFWDRPSVLIREVTLFQR